MRMEALQLSWLSLSGLSVLWRAVCGCMLASVVLFEANARENCRCEDGHQAGEMVIVQLGFIVRHFANTALVVNAASVLCSGTIVGRDECVVFQRIRLNFKIGSSTVDTVDMLWFAMVSCD